MSTEPNLQAVTDTGYVILFFVAILALTGIVYVMATTSAECGYPVSRPCSEINWKAEMAKPDRPGLDDDRRRRDNQFYSTIPGVF